MHNFQLNQTIVGCFAVLASLTAASSGAQTESDVPGRPAVRAVLADAPPLVDGNLEDAIWSGATRITQFVQQRPLEGAPATESTEVLVAYDEATLYFGIRANYGDADLIRANRADRDQTGNDDTVTVFFEPFLDQQRAYAFSVNAYGVQSDALLSNSGGGDQSGQGDGSWNALYQSAGLLTEEGWTAEMAIPIKSLRYPSRGIDETHSWGFQILREIKGKDETVSWAPISTNVLGFMPQMGLLEGMRNLSTGRTLEIMPTVTAIQAGRIGSDGAFTTDDVVEGGVNFKYGITSNLTLDATYNPDFSQIESDRAQIEVNQRFALFFPELRPFFLEGQEIFRVPSTVTFFHSRTIVDPRYGVKLTGKVGKTTFGAMLVDDEAPGRVGDPADPAFGRSATIVVARAKYDVYRESFLGGMFSTREFMQSYSRLGALDGQFALGKNTQAGFKALVSDHRDLAGIRRTGNMLDLYAIKNGRNLNWVVAHHLIDPEFTIDTGFVQRPDQRRTFGNASYRWWPQTWLVNWGPRFEYERLYNYESVLQDEIRDVRIDALFSNNIDVNAAVRRSMERFRGQDFHKTRFRASATVNTSSRVLVRGTVSRGDEIRFVANPFLGTATAYSATVTIRPWSRLQSEVDFNATTFSGHATSIGDFDVKIVRALTTYQLTDRLLVRNIFEQNTLDKTIGVNVLGTYRINAGTVFFIGYDDRYREAAQADVALLPSTEFRRTNRALFAKLQYLFRH